MLAVALAASACTVPEDDTMPEEGTVASHAQALSAQEAAVYILAAQPDGVRDVTVREETAAEKTARQGCRTQNRDVAGRDFASYRACLQSKGLPLEVWSTWWLDKVHTHCTRNIEGTIGSALAISRAFVDPFGTIINAASGADQSAIDKVIEGVGQAGGYSNQAYRQCMSDRLVPIHRKTMPPNYAQQAAQWCWGLDMSPNVIASLAVEVAGTVVGFLPIGSAAGSATKSRMIAARYSEKTAERVADRVENAVDAMIEGGFILAGMLIPTDPGVSYNGIDAIIPVSNGAHYSTAIVKFKEFKQCLRDRSVPGLELQLAVADAEKWDRMVWNYCGTAVVDGPLWNRRNFEQCLRDRNYNESTLKQDVDDKVTQYCSGAVIGGPVQSHNEYKRCLQDRNVAYVRSATWTTDVTNYCSGAVVGGRAQSHNEYKRCLADRDVPFVADASWNSAVYGYCAGAVVGSRVQSYNEYKRCLSDRGVPFTVDSAWINETTRYCTNAVAGGRASNYNAYWKCLSDRSVSFSADGAWTNEVRGHCARAVVGSPAQSYNEYKRCLSDRRAPLDQNWWCNQEVRRHCEAQFYPFGGKDKCYRDRGC